MPWQGRAVVAGAIEGHAIPATIPPHTRCWESSMKWLLLWTVSSYPNRGDGTLILLEISLSFGYKLYSTVSRTGYQKRLNCAAFFAA